MKWTRSLHDLMLATAHDDATWGDVVIAIAMVAMIVLICILGEH